MYLDDDAIVEAVKSTGPNHKYEVRIYHIPIGRYVSIGRTDGSITCICGYNHYYKSAVDVRDHEIFVHTHVGCSCKQVHKLITQLDEQGNLQRRLDTESHQLMK